jgi:hypothetical protein
VLTQDEIEHVFSTPLGDSGGVLNTPPDAIGSMRTSPDDVVITPT